MSSPALPPESSSRGPNPQDALLHAGLARLTYGLSPGSLVGAYMDWLAHLASAPGKQEELREKAVRKLTRLALFAAQAASGGKPVIDPLPQDRRFEHADWQQWPFNLYYQAFLLAQQWIWNATTGVRGVTRHHEHVVAFMARQWLDIFSPSNFLPTNPEVLRKTVASGGMNLMQGLGNWWDDLLRLAANRPPAGAERYQVGKNLALTPGKVIFRNRLMELIQYLPQTDRVHPEPVLIVPSWIMKYYILDLSPGRSLVQYLVENGHTVFMISWKNPGPEDRDIGMDAYQRDGVLTAIDAVSKLCGEKINALGYCLGGTILAIAAAVLARAGDERLNTLTLLASELDFSEPGELSLFIDESQLAFLEDIMWTRGYLDGKEMAGAFTLLNSKDLVWSRLVHDYLIGERAPVTDLMAWNADATRMPYRMHSEYLQHLYLENDLAEGRYVVDGRPVALTDIRAPLFVVGTQRDHVSPWRSVYQVHLLTDTEVTFLLTSGGHNVGVVNPPADGFPGRYFQVSTRPDQSRYIDPDSWLANTPKHDGSWWPEFLAWLNAHCGPRTQPPALGAPQAGLAAVCDAPGRYVLVS